jgi:hypothetical protein
MIVRQELLVIDRDERDDAKAMASRHAPVGAVAYWPKTTPEGAASWWTRTTRVLSAPRSPASARTLVVVRRRIKARRAIRRPPVMSSMMPYPAPAPPRRRAPPVPSAGPCPCPGAGQRAVRQRSRWRTAGQSGGRRNQPARTPAATARHQPGSAAASPRARRGIRAETRGADGRTRRHPHQDKPSEAWPNHYERPPCRVRTDSRCSTRRGAAI